MYRKKRCNFKVAAKKDITDLKLKWKKILLNCYTEKQLQVLKL